MSTSPVLSQGTGYGLIVGLGFLFGERQLSTGDNKVVWRRLLITITAQLSA